MHSCKLVSVMCRRLRMNTNNKLPTPTPMRPSMGKGSQCKHHINANNNLTMRLSQLTAHHHSLENLYSGCNPKNIEPDNVQ